MRKIDLNNLSTSLLISGGTGDDPGKILIATTPADLVGLIQPAGPQRPIPPHIDPNRPVWIGHNEGLPFWAGPRAVRPPVPRLPRPRQ